MELMNTDDVVTANANSSIIEDPILLQPVPWSDFTITPVPRALLSGLCSLMVVITTVSSVFNGLAMFITIRSPNMRKPLDYLLFNLVLADFLSALLGGIPAISANAAGKFVMGKYICRLSAFSVGTFGIGNLMTITFLSVARYVVICKPFGFTGFNQRHVVIGIILTWIWSLGWHLGPWFWGGYDLHGIGTSCGINWKSGGHDAHVFLMLYMTFCFFVPVAFMLFSYGSIIRHLRLAYAGSSLSREMTSRSEKRTTKLVLTITIAFFLCWTPYAILGLNYTFNPLSRMSHFIEMIPAYIAKTATMYNPCIYMFMNKKFRGNVEKLFGITVKYSSPRSSNVSGQQLTAENRV